MEAKPCSLRRPSMTPAAIAGSAPSISAVASGPGPVAYPSPSLDSAAAVKDIAAAISSFVRGRHVGRPLGPPVTRTQP
ncbi:hypothetical protein GUJ93_ZPchr0013g34435 [Zizania palustris]|uniref:Uncharacterized protein n=1 Tax=Zizania palustris TaxID=103762 RepID=A0A8J6BTH4_ZIZPA|nr:hypothetical protein GUJ93_ZPchr0013g34435 [Zizania palustris]